MAITFGKQKKRQQYLVLFFILLIIFIFIIIWMNFLRVSGVKKMPEIPKQKKIEINLSFMESETINNLQPFERIPAFEGEIGRENPFLPY